MVSERLPTYNNGITFLIGSHGPITKGRTSIPEAPSSFNVFTREDAARAIGQFALEPTIKPSELGSEIYLG